MLISRLTDEQKQQIELIKEHTGIKTNSDVIALCLRAYLPSQSRIKDLVEENSSLSIQNNSIKNNVKDFTYHLKKMMDI